MTGLIFMKVDIDLYKLEKFLSIMRDLVQGKVF